MQSCTLCNDAHTSLLHPGSNFKGSHVSSLHPLKTRHTLALHPLCRAVEDEREAERKRREGSAYKTKEERAREAKEAEEHFKSGNEARTLDDHKLDPGKNYYEVLGLDRAASTAEVRKAYKRLSLLYHPDKHKAESEEQQAAIAAKFREVATAFDVLTNEGQRTVYDKCRDYMETNPGKGLPPLSPEEAAQMRSGAAELSRLRRMGPKLSKHPPLMRDVEISLSKLNFGCIRAVEVERRRVDYCGREFLSLKTFHLVIRKGSREGDRITFDGEGEETADTHAGDLVFTLRAKPHPVFRRRQDKDLEVYAGAAALGDALHAVEVEMLSGGQKRLLVVHPLLEALRGGGPGGLWHTVLPGLGLFDAKLPWEAPPGDLHVSVRYPAVLLAERTVVSRLQQGGVYCLGSSTAPVPAAMVAGIVAGILGHKAEAMHMACDSNGAFPTTTAVCLRMDARAPMHQRSCPSGPLGPIPAATAAVQALRRRIPCLKLVSTTWQISLSDFGEDSGEADSSVPALNDAAWDALHDADAIILDLQLDGGKDCRQWEEELRQVRARIEDSGVLHALWQRHWRGCQIIAAGPACSLLGLAPAVKGFGTVLPAPVILPWYAVRAVANGSGWDDVCHAAALLAGTKAVGIYPTAALLVDACNGNADLLVAPTKEALMQTAQWLGPPAGVAATEADDDHGFSAAFIS